MPLVSVIVPVYDVEAYLERCIDSILNQTLSDIELVLIDDGSSDRCGEICDRYTEIDKRIKVIHQTNQGLSAARNTGLDWVFENSTSEWIGFIDSDDWIHPEYLERLYMSVNSTGTKVAICDQIRTSEWLYDFQDETKGKELITPEELFIKRTHLVIVAWGKIYHRSLWENFRYPLGKIREDEFTTWKVIFPLKQIAVVYDKLYVYYQHDNSIMHKKWTKDHLDATEAFEEQLIFYQQGGYKKAYVYSIVRYICFLAECIENLNCYYPHDEMISILRKRLKELYDGYKFQNDFSFQNRVYIRAMLSPINMNFVPWLIKRKKHAIKLLEEKGIWGVVNKIYENICGRD